MTTTKDDHPLNREPRPTGPADVRAQAKTQASGTPAVTQGKEMPKTETSGEFDPWKFGVHPVAADLRAEILANGFPQSPGPGGFWEEVGKAKPSEAPQGPTESTAKSPRDADTLRLERAPRIPVNHPLRAMAPWLVLAAVGTIVLLWLLIGRDTPKPTAPDVETVPVTKAALPDASATTSHATTPAPGPTTTPEPQPPMPTSATPSRSAGPNVEERVERGSPKHGPRTPGTAKAIEPVPTPQAPPPSVIPAPSSNTRQFSIGPR
jgi:hypothetical protein